MATDVEQRINELIYERKIPQGAECHILYAGLTYQEANDLEIAERNECGTYCDGQPGGKYRPGRVWNVYRLDW
ncbi:MAG: hypothetical protein F4X24_01500 [Rhodobacteraceae bacterium]|nr:hypothetical protein [Paracoccaceae bacterium]